MSVSGQYLPNVAMEKNSPGVSWGAIIAGAAAAAALALILLVLGVGLGLTTVSPWPGRGVGVVAFGVSTILWLVITQIIASSAGGYLAGRLRTKWATVHTDEVYFRDTAHGFLAWAIAALVSASLIGSTAVSIAATGAGLTVAASAVTAAHDKLNEQGHDMPMLTDQRDSDHDRTAHDASQKYLLHSLFRPASTANTGADTTSDATAAEYIDVGLIFANSMHSPALPSQDQQYVAQLVAKHTGLSQEDAFKRVGDTFIVARDMAQNAEQSAREAADKARKTAAHSTLWMFVSLLCGAFFASVAATFGGRQRDRVADVPVSL